MGKLCALASLILYFLDVFKFVDVSWLTILAPTLIYIGFWAVILVVTIVCSIIAEK